MDEREREEAPAPREERTRGRAGLRALPPAWRILAVLGGTMFAFVAAIVYAHHLAAQIDDEAVSIASNASPAIQHLTSARSRILHVDLAASSAAWAAEAGKPFNRAPLEDAWAQLQQELVSYKALPFYPRERDSYRAVQQAVSELRSRLTTLTTHLEQGEVTPAIGVLRGQVQPAAERLDDVLEGLITFNAEQQERLAMNIPRLRARADRVGYLLEALAAAFGLAWMWLVWRAIHAATQRILEEKRLATEHADRVAAFGQRLERLISASVRISEATGAAPDLSAVLQIIVDESRILVSADYCAFARGTDPERPFESLTSSGLPAAMKRAIAEARPLNLLGAVSRAGEPIRIPDLRTHPAFGQLPEHHPPVGPFLGIPVVRGEQNLGSLCLARRPEQAAFDDDDERAVRLLAAYIGVAIVNALLYQEARQATRAREDLLATVSHDLKNPLNTIRMATGLVRQATRVERVEESAARIDRAVQRMTRLIADLLDASKIEAGALQLNRQPEEAALLVNTIVDLFGPTAQEKQVGLIEQFPSSPLTVLCERDLVLRVFSNLVSNALKFSPAGSKIAIAIEEEPDQAHFWVKDAGPGIPAADLPHVFERYWQQRRNDRRGSGLGLYISKGIVEAHGGKIWITCPPSMGTTVHFTLPLLHGEANQTTHGSERNALSPDS